MAKNSRSSRRNDSGFVEIKSQFDAEFRRFSVDRGSHLKFETFRESVQKLHFLKDIPFTITYTDAHGDLLPINNDDNFALALSTAALSTAKQPVLRVLLQRKGENYAELNGYGTVQKKKKLLTKVLSTDTPTVGRPRIPIGLPEDFRRVSAIIDVDIVPETHRRVKLMKNGSDKPLGFYIRDGTSVRVTPQGLDKVPGIFISRLVPGGLAESTGLLAINDEVLEVNGIEVCGKTLDQVTDMMVANSSNLIITVKPVNQRLTLAPQRGGVGRYSQMSSASHMSSASGHSRQSSKSFDSDLIAEGDEDEVQDYLNKSSKSERSESSEKSDKPKHIEKGEKENNKVPILSGDNKNDSKINTSLQSNGSGRQSNNSGRQSNGSGRQSNQSSGRQNRGSGQRNNDSGRQGSGSGRRNNENKKQNNDSIVKGSPLAKPKSEESNTPQEKDNPIVTL
ncbi:Partitioning defective 6 beta [Mactra antiquata]